MLDKKRPDAVASGRAGGTGTLSWTAHLSPMLPQARKSAQIPARFIPYSFEAAEQLYLQRRRHCLEPGVHLH
jgi:hypothetical protein